MAKQKRRPPRAASLRPRVEVIRIGPHTFPPTWQPLDWLAPRLDGQFYIQHGHTDPHDHSACGPLLFCCRAAADKFQQLPDSPLADLGTWSLTRPTELAPYLERGASTLYFIFCDPIRPEGLWAIGLSGQTMWQVLFKQQPLDSLLEWSQINRLA